MAFIEYFAIPKVQNAPFTVGTDVSMLAELVGLQDPHKEKLDHYFDCNGRIIGNLDQDMQPEYKTIWKLLDAHNVTYNRDAKIEYCGQSLGVGVYISELGMPIVNDIFMIKNKEDPNAPPKCISADESCEPVLNILKVSFPVIYLKIKGHTIYHSDNIGPSSGRSGDFAVFIALWNAVYNKPAKQLIFTGEMRDYGFLHPVGHITHKLQVAMDLDIPIAVQDKNYQEILSLLEQKTFCSSHMHVAFLAQNLVDLIIINEKAPSNLDDEALYKIWKYGSRVSERKKQMENLRRLKIMLSIIGGLSLLLAMISLTVLRASLKHILDNH